MDAPDVELPAGEPRITADGLIARGPRIHWNRVEIAPRTPVRRYLVTRHLGPIAQLVCDVPASRDGCVDEHPPAGYLVTYTVVATHGAFWTGTASRPSRPVPLPGEAAPVVIDGVVVLLPGAGGGTVVPASGSGAAASAGAVPPGTGPGATAGTVPGNVPGDVPGAAPGAVPGDSAPGLSTPPVPVIPPRPPEPEQGTTTEPVEPPAKAGEVAVKPGEGATDPSEVSETEEETLFPAG
ncbi:hypothetical protein AB0M36_10175 [Actinoplanes sp. NPDC051346]|uniref:hypothetical protein n=1 Tax=Actinoplanes sp. NPDC051346 TaxID=3155048 RepID=UPI0034285358